MTLVSELKKYTGSKYKFKIVNGLEQPEWRFDSKLTPIILLPTDFVEGAFKKGTFTKAELKKLFLDPFLGIFPHEFNEAICTLLLLRGLVTDVKKKYPAWKPSKFDLMTINQLVPVPESKIKLLLVKNQLDNTEYVNLGGLAHEIIIAKNEKSYWSWEEYTNDKIAIANGKLKLVKTKTGKIKKVWL